MNIEEKSVQAAFAFVNEQKAREEADFAIKKANEYKSQKRYNADGTIKEVTLPEIAVYDGENEISVDTTVQPEKVYVQGNVEQIVTASLQTLNANLQNLQTGWQIENENSLDVMPIEKPVLNLNEVGGGESAE